MAKTVDLYRSFLDDPTLSDLTLKLDDRTVHVHRIVLCRALEYFTSLLTRSFQVSLPSNAYYRGTRANLFTGKQLEGSGAA
jgi:hypothetical protein